MKAPKDQNSQIHCAILLTQILNSFQLRGTSPLTPWPRALPLISTGGMHRPQTLL